MLKVPDCNGEQHGVSWGWHCTVFGEALDTQEDVTALCCFVSTDGIMAALRREFGSAECGREGRSAVRSSWERIYMQIQGPGKASSLS